MTQQTPFKAGERVRVSNGCPQPPKHHNRKLRRWEQENYTGTVAEDEREHIVIEPDGISTVNVRVRQLYRRGHMNVNIERVSE